MSSILCRVAALFQNPKDRTVTYRVVPFQIYTDAPGWIQSDPLYGGLLRDGSLEEIGSAAQKRVLENAPQEGITPEGKKAPGKKR